MNLLELKVATDRTIEHAKDIGVDPNEIPVSIQIDLESGEDSLWSEDVKLIYDNDGNASGCVIYGWEFCPDAYNPADGLRDCACGGFRGGNGVCQCCGISDNPTHR